MPAKPYSFRYPFDVQTAMAAWKDAVSKGTGPIKNDSDYWNVIRYLLDRDRALEDYLNLGVGQGIIASAIMTVPQTGITTSVTPITDLSVTVTVPANRRLRVTAHLQLKADSAGPTGGLMFIARDGSLVTEVASIGTLTNAASNFDYLDLEFFDSPTPGTHVYDVRVASYVGGNVKVQAGASNQAYIVVEDIGPA